MRGPTWFIRVDVIDQLRESRIASLDRLIIYRFTANWYSGILENDAQVLSEKRES